LQTYIIVFIVRVLLSCPFYVGEHFERAQQRLRFQQQQERDRRREDQVRIRRQQRRQRIRAEHSSVGATTSNTSQQEAVMPSNASTHSTTTTIIEPRSNWMTSWGERYIDNLFFLLFLFCSVLIILYCRLRSLVDLFAVLWFIVGNYLIFTTQTCARDAPKLFYTSLAYVLVGYFIVIVPLILCTSAIFCLPCVLRM
jgi:hypothetical protein